MRIVLVPFALLLFAGCGAPPPAAQAPPPPLVEVASAERSAIERTVRLLGRTTAVDAVTITTKATGTVAELGFTSGQQVTKGQMLVRLDAAREEAAVRSATGDRDKAAKELENRQPLLAKGLVSQDEIDRLAAELAAKEGSLAVAQAQLADRTVLAPFAGRIGIRRVSIGTLVPPGTAVAPLVSEDPIQVEFSVPEVHLAALKTGLPVRAIAPAWPGRVFSGTIAAIDPVADPGTRSVSCQAVVPNPDRALSPGMSLAVDLVLERVADAVVAPEGALVRQGELAWIWRVDAGPQGPTAKRVAVRTGVRQPGRVQILDGIKAGDAVIVQGLQQVRDGAPVRLPQPAASTTAAPAR